MVVKKKIAKKTAVKKVTKKTPIKRTVKAAAKKTTTKKTSIPKAKKAAPTKKTTKVKKEEKQPRLRIKVKAYEYKILDASIKQIIDTVERFDVQILGPVPLPTEIKKYTVNRSPFIFKDSREQFEIRVHRRLIDILNPSPKIIEALTNLSLPSGVGIDVKMT